MSETISHKQTSSRLSSIMNGLAVSFLLIACGAATVPGGAILARILIHERFFHVSVIASIFTVIPWLILALVCAIIALLSKRGTSRRTEAVQHTIGRHTA